MYSGKHGAGGPTEGGVYGGGKGERREGKRGNADLKGPRTIPGPAALPLPPPPPPTPLRSQLYLSLLHTDTPGRAAPVTWYKAPSSPLPFSLSRSLSRLLPPTCLPASPSTWREKGRARKRARAASPRDTSFRLRACATPPPRRPRLRHVTSRGLLLPLTGVVPRLSTRRSRLSLRAWVTCLGEAGRRRSSFLAPPHPPCFQARSALVCPRKEMAGEFQETQAPLPQRSPGWRGRAAG